MHPQIDALPEPWQRALALAWESSCAGSLGIGAVVTDESGTIIATGRNRIMERDAGDDHLAGSSLAHAETNALAKLRWRAYEGRRLTLWTTLEPCLMCSGAIRMSPIDEVRFLAPDPLFEGVEAARHLNEFIASRWPDRHGPHLEPWAVFGMLLPAHLWCFWGVPLVDQWTEQLPRVTALAAELAQSGELVAAAEQGTSIDELTVALWDRLVDASADFTR